MKATHNHKGWIGVDLDATLAKYDGWKNGEIGEPIPHAVNAVKRLLADGKEVRIVTARACAKKVDGGVPSIDNAAVQQIGDWCEKHIGQRLHVQFWKDMSMIELWDDRAIQMVPNEGVPIAHRFQEVLGDYETALNAVAISEKLWFFNHQHGTPPPEAWEELRVALGIKLPEQPLIVEAKTIPVTLKG